MMLSAALVPSIGILVVDSVNMPVVVNITVVVFAKVPVVVLPTADAEVTGSVAEVEGIAVATVVMFSTSVVLNVI